MTTTETSAPDEEHPNTPAVTDQQPAPGSDNGTENEGEGEVSGREAAKYRRQLRAAQAERDTARQQLAAIRRQAAEDASGLLKPAGLWAAGIDVDQLFGDDGRLDRDRLTEAVSSAAETLGLATAPRTPKPDPSQGSTTPAHAPTRWADALRRN